MSGQHRRLAAVALAAVGTALSAYLTWIHYSGSLALCIGAGGCEVVQASRYAMLGPVPVALVGLVGLAAMTAVASWRLRLDAPSSTLTALFGLSLAGTTFVIYLTYIELFIIHAICPWCVGVGLATLATCGLTVWDVRVPDERLPTFRR